MSTLVDVIRAHIPLDRYDEEGEPVSTYCECGGWVGDWFGDGEAGPFDEHLAAMVGEWLASACRAWAVGRFDEHGPLDQRGAALWDVAAWATEGAQDRPGAPASAEVAPGATDDLEGAQIGGYCAAEEGAQCGLADECPPFHCRADDQSRVTDSGEAARGDECGATIPRRYGYATCSLTSGHGERHLQASTDIAWTDEQARLAEEADDV